MSLSSAVLKRWDGGNDGTFGTLSVAGLRWFTGELPWRDNAPSISCIPKGTYTCKWTYSPRLKRETYELMGIAGRSGIRIHSANFVGDHQLGLHSQVNGCIALGEKIGVMDGQKALLVSKPAIRKFEQVMGGKTFILEIL